MLNNIRLYGWFAKDGSKVISENPPPKGAWHLVSGVHYNAGDDIQRLTSKVASNLSDDLDAR